MKQMMDVKISIWVVPVSWVVAAIVAIILGVTGYDWMYYIIGVCTGLLNFGLMIKTNRRITRTAELYPEAAMANSKRQAWLGFGLRFLVFVAVFLTIYFKEVFGKENSEGIWNILITFGGFATVKVVLVVVYILFRKKVCQE